jgi:hypothetical protein
MASFGDNGFDSTAKENQKENNALPAGDYPAVLVATEKKQTKDDSGSYLKMDFQIIRGEFQNQHIFTNLNLWLAQTDEKKKMAIKIAKGQLSELCRAVGVGTPKDSTELHGVPLLIRLNVKENGEYGMQNNVTKFTPMPSAAAAAMESPIVHAAGDNPWA